MARILGQLYDVPENGDDYLFYDREALNKQSLYEEAYNEAFVESREAGLAEGREVGLAEGREEKSIEIAKKLLKKDLSMSIKDIVEITTLSYDTIVKLKDELEQE